MICAIMQPSYLPWAGYFNLIATSDVFVLLDNAQYQKNSWHNRNRILLNQSAHWITVPVKKSSLNQTILNSKIDNSQSWRKKHINQLQQTYAKFPFSGSVVEICQKLESAKANNLAELNIEMICWLMRKLGIDTKIMLSSEMNIDSAIMSFLPHPRQFFSGKYDNFTITTDALKIKLLGMIILPKGILVHFKP